jgi:hypothetical protein
VSICLWFNNPRDIENERCIFATDYNNLLKEAISLGVDLFLFFGI